MPTTNDNFSKGFAANATSGSFTAKNATTTKPASTGVHSVPVGSNPKFLHLVLYGKDAANKVFNLRVWGWTQTDDATPIWIPQLLLELAVTLGATTATPVGASHFIADTIVISAGDTKAPIISPANDTGASIMVHLRGCQLVEFDVDLVDATEANAFYRFVDQN